MSLFRDTVTLSENLNFQKQSVALGLLLDTIGVDTDQQIGFDGNGNLVFQLSGTIKNVATKAISTLTQGSIPFIDASGDISEDNTNLYWNNTNNRLGIGTNSPETALHIVADDNPTPSQYGQIKIFNPNAPSIGGREGFEIRQADNGVVRLYHNSTSGINHSILDGTGAKAIQFFVDDTVEPYGTGLRVNGGGDFLFTLGNNNKLRVRDVGFEIRLDPVNGRIDRNSNGVGFDGLILGQENIPTNTSQRKSVNVDTYFDWGAGTNSTRNQSLLEIVNTSNHSLSQNNDAHKAVAILIDPSLTGTQTTTFRSLDIQDGVTSFFVGTDTQITDDDTKVIAIGAAQTTNPTFGTTATPEAFLLYGADYSGGGTLSPFFKTEDGAILSVRDAVSNDIILEYDPNLNFPQRLSIDKKTASCTINEITFNVDEIDSVSYRTRPAGVATWTPRADIAAINTFIAGLSTNSKFYIEITTVFDSNWGQEAQININYIK